MLAVAAAWAQDSATLTGTAMDSSGASVAGAKILLYFDDGAEPLARAFSGENGVFLLPGLRPGTYRLTVEAGGFQKKTVRGIRLETGTERSVGALTLAVGSVTESVEVTAPASAVQTGNAEVANTVSNEQIRRLPVLDRSPISLIRTQAGVTLGRGATTVNGMRVSFTNVTLDGVNIQDNTVRNSTLDFLPNLLLLDQVAEMTVATSNTGSAAGLGAAQVTLTTPSGGNAFHGSAIWYNRNNAYAANPWFNNRDRLGRAFLNQNQAGGSLGGAIVPNRLFFYANYEAFLLRQQTSVNRTILTGTARQGDFVYRGAGGAVQQVNLLRLRGLAIDPFVRGVLDRVPGPENINNFRVGDSSDTLVRNTGGYSFLAQNNRTRYNATGKLDYVHSERNHISGSYLWNSDLLDRVDGNTHNDYSRVPKTRNDNQTNFTAVTWRWNPRPSVTNELRGGFNFAPVNFVTTEDLGTFLVGGYTFSNPVNQLMLPETRMTRTFNYQDNLSWTRGRHTVSLGFQGQSVNTISRADNGIRPNWTIGFAPGNPMALSAADLPGIGQADLAAANTLLATLGGFVVTGTQKFNAEDSRSGFTQGTPRKVDYRYHNWAGYLQDQWRVNRRLTLQMGLRYEYWTRLEERNGLSLLPVIPAGQSPIDTLLTNSTLDFAGSMAGRPWYNKDLNNFAPNFGFAFDPTGKGKTSIRGGYSVHFVNDQLLVALDNNVISTNDGLQQTVMLRNQTARVGSGLP
ncbi:MAG TPA: TonB-dependent receptor, partial [Bryobacteraceae bacterium]|nr:TonB-dependent receptor [Bryobacteraceae bacterium]